MPSIRKNTQICEAQSNKVCLGTRILEIASLSFWGRESMPIVIQVTRTSLILKAGEELQNCIQGGQGSQQKGQAIDQPEGVQGMECTSVPIKSGVRSYRERTWRKGRGKW